MDKTAAIHKVRSEIYRVFADLYISEVTAEILKELKKFINILQLVPEPVSEKFREGRKLFIEIVDTFDTLDKNEQDDYIKELAASFAELFLNAGKNPVYIYESVYLSAEKLIMQEQRDQVLQFYRQAGYDRISQVKEPEDHLAMELQFMSKLSERIAEKILQGKLAEAEEMLLLQRDFITQHLIKWIGPFSTRMEEVGTSSFYLAVTTLLEGFIDMENECLKYYIEQVQM